MKLLIATLSTLSFTLAAPVWSEDLLIRGATVHTESSQGTLKNADVLVRGGTIAAVGSALSAPDARIIEARGRPLTPGLFGGLTSVGVEEVGAEAQTVDSTYLGKSPPADQQWRPEFDVSLAYNPRSTLVPVARVEGITWLVLAPGIGDSIIGGEGAAVVLDGGFDSVLRQSRSLFVQMGSEGAARSGGTRAAEYMLLDQAIREARGTGQPGPGSLLHPAGRETLARYLGGGRVVFAVDRAADILSTVAYARHNGMKPLIWGGSEAWVVARELARAEVTVIVNPLQDLPERFDNLAASLENAARLQRAGVRLVISTSDASNSRLVRQLAGNAVAHGLPWEAALAAITVNPATAFGLGATKGRIAVGQSADLVLWSGDPLEVSTLADQVWIGGRAMPMRSRQTELRDRYAEKIRARQAR